MKKVLITGGAGFIGSHLAAALSETYKVVVLDDLTTGSYENLKSVSCDFIEGSITDKSLVDQVMKDVDYVFHFAAMVSVALSMEQPQKCVEVNVGGLLNILDASVSHGVKKVIFASSAAVYGNTPESPKREDQLPQPESPYAITKLDGEYYLEMYSKIHGLASAAPRFFNVYGVRQDPQGAYAAAVPIFFDRAKVGLPISIHGDGCQTRDFIHVSDIVAGLVMAMDRPEMRGSFNLAGGGATSISDLVEEIVLLTHSSSEIIYTAPRAGDIKHSLADVSKAKGFGFEAKTHLSEGLKTMLV